jgi:mercuric ion transport protein
MKLTKHALAVGASIVSAVAGSLCCIGPIGTLLLGTGGFAGATVFTKWRLPLLGATMVLLGLAWYLTSIAPKQMHCDSGVCFTRRLGDKRYVVLWVATAFIIAVATVPMCLNVAAERFGLLSRPITNRAGANVATLHASIPSMDCAACAIPIRMKLYQQAGVRSVAVKFATKQAEVQYDPAQISSDQILSKITETGFKAESTTPRKSQ